MTEVPAFASIPVPARQGKPRSRGITMMIDWGMGLARQEDTIASAGGFVDLAKIAAGIPRLLPRTLLVEKLARYRAAGIATSPGGLFVELALAQGSYGSLLDEAVAVGFGGIEVSTNLLTLSPREKAEAIARAKRAGFHVYGEVGRKEGDMSDDEVVADFENCVAAGADHVFLEAYELFRDGAPRTRLIDRLGAHEEFARAIFELPVVVLPGVSRDYKHRVAALMVRSFGTEVNLANVEWDEIYLTECVRRGLAGDTSHPQGAYRLAGFPATG